MRNEDATPETYDGDTTIDFNGVTTRIADLPDPGIRAELGYGHFPFDIEHREVHAVPGRTWPYTPQTCLTDRYGGKGEWLNERVLVCPGCGLDFT